MLECVQDARATLQNFPPHRPLEDDARRHADHVDSATARSLSPTGASKRGPEDNESIEHDSIKRQRTASYQDHHSDRYHVAGSFDEQRRASDSLQKNQPLRTFSPAHSDSWTSSAQIQQQSPSFYGRSLRPLPSPSSLATASQKAFWSGPAVAAPPGSSPTSVNQAPTSIHTAPTSSAASQHIADLQHQVTLKSLSLQTLQSEYTSLLQKSQRDRLKSQTFEKKAMAADQEINDLTTRNEELVEQVRTLESQLDECEKKRETERSDAVREKEQWGRMLEMSGRLQAKSADDRQKLVQEKESLCQRIIIYENEAALSVKRRTSQSLKESPLAGQYDASIETSRGQANEATKESASRIAVLQLENETLQKRTYLLRSVLMRMEEQYASFMEKRRKLMEQEITNIPDAIQMALREDSAFARPLEHQCDEAIPARRDHMEAGEKRGLHDQTCQSGDSQPRTIQKTAPTSDRRTEKVHLSPSISRETDHRTQMTSSKSAQELKDFSDAKTDTRPKLHSVPIPKWQPPGRPALRTEYLENNQRRPSGPATPFPGSEHAQWQASEAMRAQISPPSHRTPSPPQAHLPAFGIENTPARNFSPQYITPSSQNSATGSESSDRFPPAAAMPPPPRPGPDPSSASSSTATSWRPS